MQTAETKSMKMLKIFSLGLLLAGVLGCASPNSNKASRDVASEGRLVRITVPKDFPLELDFSEWGYDFWTLRLGRGFIRDTLSDIRGMENWGRCLISAKDLPHGSPPPIVKAGNYEVPMYDRSHYNGDRFTKTVILHLPPDNQYQLTCGLNSNTVNISVLNAIMKRYLVIEELTPPR